MKYLLLLTAITLFNCSNNTLAPSDDTFTVYKAEYTWDNNQSTFIIPLDTTNLHHYWYSIIVHDFDTDQLETYSTSNWAIKEGSDYFIEFKTVNYLDMRAYWEDFRNGSQTIVKLVLHQAYKY